MTDETRDGDAGRGGGPLARLRAGLWAAPALLLTLTALFWAGNAIAGQLAAGEIAPMTLTALRWLGVSAVLWPLYGRAVVEGWPLVRPKLKRVVLMAVLGFACFNALLYAASLTTTAVNVGILQGSMPVFVLIGAYLALGDRVGGVQAAGVALTLVGVVLVATKGAPLAVLEQGVNPGDGLMLIACVLYAGYAVALRGRPALSGPAFFTLLAPIELATALPMAAVEVWSGAGGWPTPVGWAVVAYTVVFPSIASQIFFLRGVDLIGPGRAGVFINLVPVFAACLAVALLGQPFEAYHAGALALVLVGVWLGQRPRRG
ncbi:MAG: DMT family transporter [Paracoccaceae bacterium]